MKANLTNLWDFIVRVQDVDSAVKQFKILQNNSLSI